MLAICLHLAYQVLHPQQAQVRAKDSRPAGFRGAGVQGSKVQACGGSGGSGPAGFRGAEDQGFPYLEPGSRPSATAAADAGVTTASALAGSSASALAGSSASALAGSSISALAGSSTCAGASTAGASIVLLALLALPPSQMGIESEEI